MQIVLATSTLLAMAGGAWWIIQRHPRAPSCRAERQIQCRLLSFVTASARDFRFPYFPTFDLKPLVASQHRPYVTSWPSTAIPTDQRKRTRLDWVTDELNCSGRRTAGMFCAGFGDPCQWVCARKIFSAVFISCDIGAAATALVYDWALSFSEEVGTHLVQNDIVFADRNEGWVGMVVCGLPCLLHFMQWCLHLLVTRPVRPTHFRNFFISFQGTREWSYLCKLLLSNRQYMLVNLRMFDLDVWLRDYSRLSKP